MKKDRPTKEEIAKKIEEEVQVNIPIAKGILENNLLKFNKFVLKVEDGKDKVPLAPFHQELCTFIEKNKSKKKLLLIPRGHLKALRTGGTKVLTVSGYLNYDKLEVGSEIIGGDGSITRVVKIHPKSKMELYEVTTNDGRKIACNLEHLFKIRLRQNSKRWKVKNLKWILPRYRKERLDKRNGKTYFEHPVQLKPIPVLFLDKELPIDPYTLGMWLGDGHSAGSRMSCAYPEMFKYSVFKWHKTSGKYNYDTHGLQKKLRLTNLLKNKHIPSDYLISGYKQRIELLRGLMDSDGTCHVQGGIAYFSNTNYRLIKDFVSLVRSLGGVAMVCKVNQEVNGEPYDTWTVSVKLPDNINPFNLKRKARMFTGLKRELTVNIVDIEKVDDDIANCITVDGDGMFITDDYFPTHNSTLVTIGYSLQQLLKDPSKRILIANATYNLACNFLTDIKRHLKFNDKIHLIWGDLSQNPERWSSNEIALATAKGMHGKKEPNITAMGLESNLTSQHYDIIIGDDLVNKDYVNTADQIQKTINFYKEALNLLEPNGEFILIGTRWHDSDLYGWIMDNDNNVLSDFEVMVRKAYEGDLYGDDFQPLFPQKFKQSHLKSLREQQGPYFFSAQYMNDPIPDDEADFKREWFSYYDFTDLKGRPLNKFTMIDPAISTEKESDFTAIVTTGVDNHNNIYILDIRRVKANAQGVIDEIFKVYEQWHPIVMGIEEVAFQKALRYALHQEMNNRNLWLPLREVKPQARTKDQRIRGLQPLYANRKIYHNKGVTNNMNLEDELLRFPRGKHDDVVDALSYGLDIWYPGKRKVSRRSKHKYLYA